MEQRTLLSVAGAGDDHASLSGTPTVDVAWFEQLASTTEAYAPPTLALRQSQPYVRPVNPLNELPDASAHRWVVQLTPEATQQAGSVAGAADLLAAASFQTRVIGGLGLEGMVLLETESGLDLAAVDAWLSSDPSVAYYEPDALLDNAVLPDDLEFSNLWGFDNTGQTGGTVDADIDAPEAWDLATGTASIVVAVIDTGVDYTHPDLAANIWTNPGEVPGNGIDDDGNGFVDDVHGYDFVNADGDPVDDNGHGTHVSGTIAAVGNNGQGVAGVNWTGSVMALKFLDSEGNGFTSTAVAALNYATMMRSSYGIDVRVANASWGGGVESQALYDAIQASGEEGILFVAASGNDGIDVDQQSHYPASYDLPSIIAVAAADHDDELASFSNYGAASIDLAAPGVNIYSTLPGGTYGYRDGTSMAAPHVAGAAALAWALTPNATVQQVRDVILAGVDQAGSLGGRVATGGRLNVRSSLDGLSINVMSSDPAAGSAVSTPPNLFTIQFTHAYDPATIDASDLLVNGTTADSVLFVDSSTVTFQFQSTPVVAEGPQLMEIGAGTILRAGNGDPISAWQATFYYDLVPMAVISAAPSEGETLPTAPAQIVLDFNESIDPQSVDMSDLLLDEGSVAAAAAVDDDSVAFTVSGLPQEGEVVYRLRKGAIGDANGTPGSAYVGSFTIDNPLIEQYVSADVPQSITDYATTTSAIVVGESFAVADLDVQIDISHTYDADLDVNLVAPDGTRVTLLSRVGGSGDDFYRTILDDEAETAIADGEPPFRGRYRPEQPLSTVDNLDVMGTWTLEIYDHGGLDEGALNGWSLTVERGPALAPRIRSVDPLPPDGGEAWADISDLYVFFSRDMDPSSVNDLNPWELLEAGPDGLFDTADDVDYPLAVSPQYVDGLTATLVPVVGRLPEGVYRFTAASGGLTDLSGTPLDGNGDGTSGDDYVTHFTVLPSGWYLSSDVPQDIRDYRTVTSTLTIDESFPVADVDVRIDITHTYDADLDVYLIAPNGTRVELFTDVGASGHDFSGTILDDEADTGIADGQAPFNGRYRPEQPLAAVDGLNAAGTWTLEISDDGVLDDGTLNGWAMHMERGALVAPQLSSIAPLPADGGQLWGPVDRLEVRFSEVMDAASVNSTDHWDLLQAGADGAFGTVDDARYSLNVVPPYANGLTATLEPAVGRLPAGSYRLTVASGGLVDLFGSPLDGDFDGVGGDDYVTHFTILPGNRYASDDVPKNIIDLTTVTSTLSIDESVAIADINVEIDITHTYNSDLDIYLVAPDGTRIELLTDVGGRSDGFVGTVLDDEAGTPINRGTAPFSGRYSPEGMLSVVDGSDARGVWTLEITDDSSRDQGTLNGWALIVDSEPELPPRIVGHVPDETTLGPVGSVRFDFDRPMNDQSFTLADDLLSFVGPQGAVIPTGYNWLDPQSLEIQFDSQWAAGRYTMVVGPQILDAAGVALDGDGDLLPGEIPDDQYTATFLVAQPLGPIDFLELGHSDPSAGELWYRVETTRQGILTVEARFQGAMESVELALYDEARTDPPLEVSTPVLGSQRIDREVAGPGEVYYVKLTGSNADVDLRLANLLSYAGRTVNVHGTDGADQLEFDARVSRRVTINGVAYEFGAGDVSSVNFDGVAGEDSAVLHGSDARDTLELWPDRGVLVGEGYVVTVAGIESVTAHGGDTDIAYLHDDPLGKDYLEATPDYATLSGNTFDHSVWSFRYVHCYGTEGGGDEATFYDDIDGQDTFLATPTEGRLYSDRFYNRALSFDHVEAYATAGGSDLAYLYDDPLNKDVLEATPEYAKLSGTGFDNQAFNFRYVRSYATKGSGDEATLYDDADGRDTFLATPTEGRLYSDRFYNRALSFDHVYAYATAGGTDVAYVYDDPLDKDVLEATPEYAKLSGTAFDNQAFDFRYVRCFATKGGGDEATLYDDADGRDTFLATPTEGRLYSNRFYNRALSFDHVYAYATAGGTDVAYLYDDPLDKDLLEATPEYAKLSGNGFDNQVFSFRYVHSYATKGGGDEATLYDDAQGRDIFRATPTFGKLYGDRFYNRALYFDHVYAHATSGGSDVAYLYDDPLEKDIFEARPNHAELSGTGYDNQVFDFRYVESRATRGAGDEATLYDDPQGRDVLRVTPTYGKLNGDWFYYRAVSFDSLRAVATAGGTDVAYLYDDPLEKDIFEARPNYAKLSGKGYAGEATSFRYVIAYATPGGDDEAFLRDSKGNDSFEATPDDAELSGADFYCLAKSFRYVTASATAGGDDTARLVDSALDDLLEIGQDWVRLSNALLGFANKAVGFGTVEVVSSDGDDTADVSTAVDFLITYGLQ